MIRRARQVRQAGPEGELADHGHEPQRHRGGTMTNARASVGAAAEAAVQAIERDIAELLRHLGVDDPTIRPPIR